MAANTQSVFGFELGNEVNNNGGTPWNTTTRPAQQADAMKLFAPLVRKAQPDAMLIGPDTGYRDAEAWLQAYLPLVSEGGRSILHAVTHHVYDAPGRSAFNSPSGLDSGRGEIAWYTDTIRSLAPSAQIWAGEDGPVGGGNDGSCGGEASVCTTYASALTYADDLGLRARAGFSQYQRQSLFGGGYGLTDTRAKHPQSALGETEPLVLRPGYWVRSSA